VGAVSSYTFEDVAANHTIDATFAINVYTITATAGANGSISPSGSVTVSHGGEQSFAIVADPGHHILDVLVDGVSVGAVSSHTFTSVSADHTIAASFEVNPPVPAITNLSAATIRTGNDSDGTTRIQLTWTGAASSATVEVFRASFGNHPLYSSGGSPGSVPEAPTYPPSAPWVATSLTSSGSIDEPADRDFYYYVAFVTDSFGTVSPVSNRTAGTLNYHLGDVSNGVAAGQGDNQVTAADLSLLGAWYGLSGAAVAPVSFLDVGPTTDFSVHARPVPDAAIEFEDLVMFALNYGLTSAPQGSPVAAVDELGHLAFSAPASVTSGEEFDVVLRLTGDASIRAISVGLGWDPTVVEPIGPIAGSDLESRGGMVLSAAPGVVDAALLGTQGAGIAGDFAIMRFRALQSGSAGIGITQVRARDAWNSDRTVEWAAPLAIDPSPGVTRLAGAYPNPSRNTVAIEFSLARAGATELVVYGVDGRRIRTLAAGWREAGRYRLEWDGRDDHGALVAPGVYYARLDAGDRRFTRTLVRVR
jgi:hypothetical protein